MSLSSFSFTRLFAMIYKEFIQMLRDKPTLGMIIGVPCMQLILFGLAINTNPQFLPTALVQGDNSVYTRQFIAGLENSHYFKITAQPNTQKEADELLARGDVTFILTIPPQFTRDFIRNDKPQILFEADGANAIAIANAFGVLPILTNNVFKPLNQGAVNYLNQPSEPVNLIRHIKYNPELLTAYSIVPGLMGVALTMTMAGITGLAMVRERERGTLEHLLSMPIRPLEVILGKIIPFILVGYLQITLILFAAVFLFSVPLRGNIFLLYFATLPFIAANLGVGLTNSTLAKNQLQALQMSFFYFLPSILLSGFMFPFEGMPMWAQMLGHCLPLTYFLKIVRGILLKGNDFTLIFPALWPIFLILVVVLTIGVNRYRQTLD